MAAAVAQHRDPAAGQPPRLQQRLRPVDHLGRRRDQVHARGAAGGLHRRQRADQRPGVRPGSAGAGVAAPDRDQDHGLLRGGGGRRERAPVAEVLRVDGDQLGGGMLGVGGDQLGHVEVGLVADRREPREAERVTPRHQAQLERQVSALRDQPDRPGRELVRAEAQIAGRVIHTQAVGAEQHRAGVAHPLHQRALAGRRVAAGLAQPGGDAHKRAGAHRQRVVDRLLEAGSRHGDHDQLGRLRQLRDDV